MKRKLIIILTALTLLLTSNFANAQTLIKETFIVDVQNNQEIQATVLGYYKDLPDGKQVFIECNPDGTPTGEGYVKSKVGTINREVTEMEELPPGEDLDWDNPIQIKPLTMTLFMPNVPINSTVKKLKTTEDGTLVELKTQKEIIESEHQSAVTTNNAYQWTSGGRGYAIYLPSDDPNDWIIVAEVKNNNNFAVKATVGVYIPIGEEAGSQGLGIGLGSAMSSTAGYTGPGVTSAIHYNEIHEFAPNEKKQILISDKKFSTLMTQKGYREGQTRYVIGWSEANYGTKIIEIHTDKHPTEQLGEMGGFVPFGSNQKKYPIQLSFDTGLYSARLSGSALVTYNPRTNNWDIRRFVPRTPQDKIEDIEAILKPLFGNWGFKVPLLHNPFGKDTLQIGGATFTYIRPQAWIHSNQKPSYGAAEFTAPIITDRADIEHNYVKAYGKFDEPAGTFEEHGYTQFGCYDLKWMNVIPVMKTNPMFIEKYTFTKTNGNEGYLTKTFVPGIHMYRGYINRPTVNWERRLQKITATQNIIKYGKGSEHITYEWTENDGWIIKEDTTSSGPGVISWENVIAEYKNIVTANNPNSSSVSIISCPKLDLSKFLKSIYGSLIINHQDPVSFANPFARSKDNTLIPAFPENEIIATADPFTLTANSTKTVQEFSSDISIHVSLTNTKEHALPSILQTCRTATGTKEAAWVNGTLYLEQPQLSNYGNILYGSQEKIYYKYETNDKYRDIKTADTKVGFDWPPAITGTSYSRSLFLELDNQLLESPEAYRILSSGACGNFPYRCYNQKNKTFTLPD